MDSEKKNVTVSFLIGAAIGAGVAYFVSDSGRKKTPELYDYIKKSLESLADDPQKTIHLAENEVKEKATEIKDTVNETIESIKTIGSLNIDKLLPRDTDERLSAAVDKLPDLPIDDSSSSEVAPKKPRKFFKRK